MAGPELSGLAEAPGVRHINSESSFFFFKSIKLLVYYLFMQ